MGFSLSKFIEKGLDPFDLIDTGGSLAPSNLLDPGKDEREAALLAQQEAGDEAIRFHQEALDTVRADLAPFREAGVPAAQQLLSPLSAQDLLQDPFFTELAQDQEQRLLRQQAALGRTGFGETRDILNRNLLLLGNQFRGEDFNRLLNTATLGQNAAAQTGTAAQGAAGNIGNLLTQIGNANAASQIANSQAQNQLLGTGISALGSAGLGAAGLLPGVSGGLGGAGIGALVGLLCDRRVKENITEVHTDDDGLKVYIFNYVGDDKKYLGKMAQDIIEVDPDHCSMNDEGYFVVSEKYAPIEVA